MEELEEAISHWAWKHKQFVAVRGVGVCGICGIGQAGVFGAGQAVGIMFCLVSWPSTEQEPLTVPVPALAPWAEVAGEVEVPGCPLGLSLRAVPLALSSEDCPSGTIQGSLGLVPASHQEEISLVSSFSAHFTHHLVSGGISLSRHWNKRRPCRAATLLVLFLLSLLRQGSIKRVFALRKPRITPHLLKVFRTATFLSPAPLLELLQSEPVPAVPVPAVSPAQTEPLFALLGVCRGGCSPSSARTS